MMSSPEPVNVKKEDCVDDEQEHVSDEDGVDDEKGHVSDEDGVDDEQEHVSDEDGVDDEKGYVSDEDGVDDEKGHVSDEDGVDDEKGHVSDEDMDDEQEIKQELESDTEVYDSSVNDPSTSDPLRSPESVQMPDSIKLEPQVSEQGNSEVCRLCGRALTSNVLNVSQRGLTTLQMYSEIFQDNKFPSGVYPVQIHSNCRTKYTQGISKTKLEAEISKRRRNLSNFSNEKVMTAIPQSDSEILQSESMQSEPDLESPNCTQSGRPKRGHARRRDARLPRGCPPVSPRGRGGAAPGPGGRGSAAPGPGGRGVTARRSGGRRLRDLSGEPAPAVPLNDSEISPSEPMETDSVPAEGSAAGAETPPPPPPPDRPGYCRICSLALTGDVATVRAMGMRNLQRASLVRRDGLFPPRPETDVQIHVKCRNRYTEDRSLAAAVKRRLKQQLHPTEPAIKPFDYHEQCLVCGEAAGAQFARCQLKLPRRRRDTVRRLTKKSAAEKMYQGSLDSSGPDIEAIRERLKDPELMSRGARYHAHCYERLLRPPPPRPRRPGRAVLPATLQHAARLLALLQQHEADPQLALNYVRRALRLPRTPLSKVILDTLRERYDKVLVTDRDILVTEGIDLDEWHAARAADADTERLRIVRAAANIVLEDIRSVVLDDRRFPPPDEFLEADPIPASLKIFLDTVVTKYKSSSEYERVATALAHAAMAAARPRTFKSPLLLAIGSSIHRKHGSKSLIDLLSSLGFCASYEDVVNFETSVACHEKPGRTPEFTQFVFDSVDTHNAGYTGPALVGVRCDAPRTRDSPITRVDGGPPNILPGSYDDVPLQKYTQRDSGLKNVVIEDHEDDTAVLPTDGDALWLFGKGDPDVELPEWDSFMAKVPKEKKCPASDIRVLPVIFAPVSEDSIYTALRLAREKTEPERTCLVTFDRPLYQQAQDIVKSGSRMSNIVLRLGGFHLLTSFLGAIGYIMSGSGLEELWGSVYGAERVEKMMTGLAPARALRAHSLTRSALFNIITKDFDLTPDDKLEIEGILDEATFCIPQTDSQGVKRFRDPLAMTLELLEKHGPAAKLWVQYFRMTTLAAQFVEAERTANWELHLSAIKKMLPYFHAAGNFEYAKSCTLYLQDMKALESKMSADEYERFTKKGYFAMKRTDKIWADVWLDRSVEETMTNVMKRGQNDGSGITDGVLKRFIAAGPVLSTISDALEDFCRPVQNETSEPGDKNNEEFTKIRSWFEEHRTFSETENMVSIGMGGLGENVNCHEANEIGKRMMTEKVGQNFQDVRYQRDKCVRPLSSDKSAVQIENFKVPVEPDTILRRIHITDENKENLKPYFEYELAPYPLSLFNEYGMLKADKSTLFDLFVPVEASGDKRAHVIDGEYLLRRVKWEEGADVYKILDSYTKHVKKNFTNAIVMFDRHGTKAITRTRKRTKIEQPTIDFQKNTVLKTGRDNFLSNQNNKAKFIQYLLIHFMCSDKGNGINVKFTSGDVDSEIVKTAVEFAAQYDASCIVSDDEDLLSVMCARANKKNVYFMRPSRGKTPTKYYHVDSLRSTKIKLNILFVHAVSGCDTTSAIFQHDKMKVAAAVESMSSKEIKDLVTVFRNPKSDRNAVAKVEENFFRHLYGVDNLRDGRYDGFKRSLTRSRYDLACLPPSREACIQHTYRTFHQVQKWLGNDLLASDWGWQSVGDRLEPIKTSNVDLKKLLDLISCKCVGVCSECVCKRASLDCCVLCLNCNGKRCHGVDMDAYGRDHTMMQESDVFDNPHDPRVTDEDDSSDEEAPRPVSPKRLRKDAALLETTRETDDEVREVEVEQVYLVEQNDDYNMDTDGDDLSVANVD